MKIDIRWFSDDQDILHIVFYPHWTWDDFHEMRVKAKNHLREVEHPVAILLEYDDATQMPPPNSLSNLTLTFETAEANSALAVLVTHSIFWRVILRTLGRVLPYPILKNTYFVSTREEALALIESKMKNESS